MDVIQDYEVAEFFNRLSVQDFKIFKKLMLGNKCKGFDDGVAAERSVRFDKSGVIALVNEMLTELAWLCCITEKHHDLILKNFENALEKKYE